MHSRAAVLPLVAITLALLAGCTASPDEAPTEPSSAAAGIEGCDYIEDGEAARYVDLPTTAASGTVDATLQTTVGDIPLTLDADRTPCTVASFLSLTAQWFYDDTPCHRLTTAGIFVLQCGDPTGSGSGGPGYRYADELDGTETYPAGTVAMANAGPDTNGSQFFLVYEDSQLPPSYTVFGELSPEGLDIVRTVAADGVADGGGDGSPATPIMITAITTD